ncbi:hypothetical protein L596_012368 [Steinernema carpocapsae]|uniref:Uncharacterized protein n=1 Tax=Steinernema carpocapsae TaxID=34508 RepID=A0A4U5NX84_STECR|nr:hypothetical protein L596_012368 [Steinernema carpocapsae]
MGISSHVAVFVLALVTVAVGKQTCPANPSGIVLQCAFECCQSLEGANQGYYCCGPEDRENRLDGSEGVNHGRAERFIAYGSTLQFCRSLAGGLHNASYWPYRINYPLDPALFLLLPPLQRLLASPPPQPPNVRVGERVRFLPDLLRVRHPDGHRSLQHSPAAVPRRRHVQRLVDLVAPELPKPRAIQRRRHPERRPQKRPPRRCPQLLTHNCINLFIFFTNTFVRTMETTIKTLGRRREIASLSRDQIDSDGVTANV